MTLISIDKPMDTIVAVTRCESYEPASIAEAIARQFDLSGGIEKFIKRGDTLLLKPNFIASRSRGHDSEQ